MLQLQPSLPPEDVCWCLDNVSCSGQLHNIQRLYAQCMRLAARWNMRLALRSSPVAAIEDPSPDVVCACRTAKWALGATQSCGIALA